MATISVTDQVNLTASVEVSDDSPLAQAKLTNLQFSSQQVVANFTKPVDEFMLDEVEVEIGFAAPSVPLGNGVGLTVSGSETARISVVNFSGKALFSDTQFAPAVAIKKGECWAGLSLDLHLQGAFGISVDGVGLSLTPGSDITTGTWIHFPFNGTGIPTFGNSLVTLIENYAVPTTAKKLREMPANLAYTVNALGKISFGASYSAPLSTIPLATLDLLNLAVTVPPPVEATVQGAVTIQGNLILRAYLSAPEKLVLGVYKKRQTSLSATLCASAGVGVDIGTTDILAKVLGVIVSPADLDGLHLDESQTADLRDGLKDCVDQSISIALNACCTATSADEAAVIYELDLSSGDSVATDAALTAALRGDWSKLETLTNAKPLRHIVRELHEQNHKLTLNLLGLYNARSVTDYLQSSTILQDENGQMSLVDKVAAKSLMTGTTPYAAKADKLRDALAQAFLATVTYGAGAGKIVMKSFEVRQSLLDYKASAGPSDLTRQILLARFVGLASNASYDAAPKSAPFFAHEKFCLDIKYELPSILRLFYQDGARTPYTPDMIDQAGRTARIKLLDPIAPNAMQRRMALSNNDIWDAMNANGNVTKFSTITGLARLSPAAVAAIAADWTDIRWWSDAMQSVTPKLTTVLAAIDESTSINPLSDAKFVAAHNDLEKAMKNLSHQTHSAFGDGWPLAVMYALATSTQGQRPTVEMDFGWNGQFQHEASDKAIAQTTGA